MHDFVICYRVWCKEAENEQSDKNLRAWAESEYQFGHLLSPTTYLILLYSWLYLIRISIIRIFLLFERILSHRQFSLRNSYNLLSIIQISVIRKPL